MKNLYKIQDELFIVSDKEKSSYCIKECPMAGLNIDRCDCQIFNACSNKVGNIILTTNKLLIKDGVQEIPDEFLEWFVKNTSCETIKVNHYGTCCGNSFISQCINCEKYKPVYKIIIPKEEIICESMTDTKAFKLIFGDMQDAQEENHNYLPGFIQQFDPEEGELNNKDWSAVDFLKWLELNKFKIIK